MTTVHKVDDTNQLHLLIFKSEASSKLANGEISFIKDNQVKLTQQAEVCLCIRSEVDVNLMIRECVIKLFLQSIRSREEQEGFELLGIILVQHHCCE